jgi:predicted oxidoreductase
MQQVALGDTGIQVSRLSSGTAFMGPLSDHLSPQEGAALLLQALDQGISTWDTSDDYGTHPHVACALQRIPREEVTVSSKLREPGTTVEQVLDELGTPYLDILFVHEVTLAGVDMSREMLRAWQGEKERGRVRAVGISTHSVRAAQLAAAWPEVEVLMVPINPTGVCTPESSIEDGDVEQVLDATPQTARGRPPARFSPSTMVGSICASSSSQKGAVTQSDLATFWPEVGQGMPGNPSLTTPFETIISSISPR